jgi:tetratricopeptide (TPR) repeat protein
MRANQVLLLLCCGLFFFAVSASALPPTAEMNTYQRHLRDGANLLNRQDFGGARDAFEEALRSYDGDVEAYLGLAVACFHLNRDEDAERALRQAIEINPREKRAYQVLGDLAYRRDDLDGAISNWERVIEIDPSETGLKARIGRLRRESRTEKDFNREVTSHFSVKYEGRERIEAGKIVLRILEDAYSEIGRQLSFYPDQEIAVILYSDRQFREVTDAPGWSAGLYDGKIRIPIGGIEQETPGLRRLLYHEYTHAVVRAITPRVPTWLNEGLAQYCEGRKIDGQARAVLRALAQAGKLPALRSLEGPFTGLGGAQADYAYLISLSAVSYLGDQFGIYRVRMVLDELARGAEVPRAIENSLLISSDDFERGWRNSLE